MKLPKQIQNILIEDEVIKKSFDLKGCQVYATEKRLLVIEGRTVRDFDYAHIPSIAYSSKGRRGLVAFGTVLLIIAFSLPFVRYVGVHSGPWEMAILIVPGLTLIVAGIILKSERVEINVVGISSPIKFRGSRQDLDSLLQIIRQKRMVRHVAETETKED